MKRVWAWQLLVCLLLFSAGAAADEWVYLDEANDVKLYYNPSTVEVTKRGIEVVFMAKPKRPQDFNDVAMIKTICILNRSRQRKDIVTIAYDQGGNVVDKEVHPENGWTSIEPGSTWDTLWQAVMKKAGF